MRTLAEQVGHRIRELRRERGLAQAGLADLAGGMSVPFLSAVERGLKNPSLETLERLAESLEVPVRDLLPQDTPPPRKRAQEPAERVAMVVGNLAQDASSKDLKRFEQIARAFFKADRRASASQFERMARAYFRT